MRQPHYRFGAPERVYEEQGELDFSLLSESLRESCQAAIQDCHQLLDKNQFSVKPEIRQEFVTVIFRNFLDKQKRLQPLKVRYVRERLTPAQKAIMRRGKTTE